MPKFDPELAKAELYRFEVLINHNLRQMVINRDHDTAQHYHHQLQTLARRTLQMVGQIRRLKTQEEK